MFAKQEWQESVAVAQKKPGLKILEASVNSWFGRSGRGKTSRGIRG